VGLATGAIVALVTVAGPSSDGWAKPGPGGPAPSAGEVAKSRQKVRNDAAAVGRVKALLAEADGELDRLVTGAEVAVERYNGEMVKLHRAQADYADASRKLTDAQVRLAAARRQAAVFASQAYRFNGGVTGLGAAMGGAGGPQAFMDREDMLQVLAGREAGALDGLRAAKEIADVFSRQAAKALRDQQRIARAATAAETAANTAVDRQRAAVQFIAARKAALVRQLGAAEAGAEELQQRRAAAIEAARQAAAVRAASASPGGKGPSSGLSLGSGRGAVAVRAALSWLGTPYSWGGGDSSGPTYGVAQGAGIKGFDCSGLMLYAWSKAGVQLDHWTGTQWTAGPHVPIGLLRPGDLLFFATNTNDPDTIHHVGMYIGQGQMIEAPYTGARVRISSIWRHDLIGATRPLA
jgi:cell wall-associated NlpC family hydrolase